MHATYRFEELPGLPGGTEMEMILDGSTFYMRMPALSGAQGLPTEWVSMDINEAAPGFESLLSLSQGQNDPTSSLSYLDGITDAEVVGTETVAGVETTHYHGTVDPSEAFHRLADDADRERARRRSRKPRRCSGTPPCRSTCGSIRMAFSDGCRSRWRPPMTRATPFAMEMSMEITDYGISADLPIPDPSDVTDLTRMIPDGDY